jgi:hypothetical protein
MRSPAASPEPEKVKDVAPCDAPDHVPDPVLPEMPKVTVESPLRTNFVCIAPLPRNVTPRCA